LYAGRCPSTQPVRQQEIDEFRGHDGFDGVMLGWPGAAYPYWDRKGYRVVLQNASWPAGS
jgi:hypothetical protein